jgi:hypothetical protein
MYWATWPFFQYRSWPSASFRTSPPKANEIRNPVKTQYNQILSGSRLASAACGLGRDDELRIAKLGTRPKGGSPKDNCEFKIKEPALRQAQDRWSIGKYSGQQAARNLSFTMSCRSKLRLRFEGSYLLQRMTAQRSDLMTPKASDPHRLEPCAFHQSTISNPKS